MQIVSLVWGILAFIGFLVAFFPCLGSLNWLNIPFSVIGLVISLFALNSAQLDQKNIAIAGVAMCAIAVVGGMLRLILGGGLF